jgi:hypothetical protein
MQRCKSEIRRRRDDTSESNFYKTMLEMLDDSGSDGEFELAGAGA